MPDISVSIDGEEAFKDEDSVIAQDINASGEVSTRVDKLIAGEVDYEDLSDLSEEEVEQLRKEWADSYYPLPDDFPGQEQLEGFAKQFGKIRIRRVAPKEAYVVRKMNRAEFRQFLKSVEKFGKEGIDNRMYQEELMCEVCIVWPKVTIQDIRGETDPFAPIASAGTASILSADIQELSNMAVEAIGPIEEL